MECKFTLPSKASFPSLSFRLTIWNVNTGSPSITRKTFISFRLTIWNVNFATYDGEMITLTGFILTMWT